MAEDNICRLCLSTDELIWIFDNRMAENIKDIIFVTTGVEILDTDRVTQKVCRTCCQITIRMYKYRLEALRYDKELKSKSSKYNKSDEQKVSPPAIQPKPEKSVHPSMHPSLENLKVLYPNIKLPKLQLDSHFGPYITLMTNEVDAWYKSRNYSEKEIRMLKSRTAGVDIETDEHSYGPKSKKFKSGKVKTGLAVEEIMDDSRSSPNHIDQPVTSAVIANPTLESNGLAMTESVIRSPVTNKSTENSEIIQRQVVSPLLIKMNRKKSILETGKRTSAPRVRIVFSEINDLKNSDKSGEIALRDNNVLTGSNRLRSLLESLHDAEKTKNKISEAENPTSSIDSDVPIIKDGDDVDRTRTSKKKHANRLYIDTDDERELQSTPLPLNVASDDCVADVVVTLDKNTNETFDSSLWSSKSSTVYTCKICNQVYQTFKYLKYHEKLRHTKCPFCGRKFPSIDLKNKHVSSSCKMKSAEVKCKNVTIRLTKIDKMEEIRKQYPNAFDVENTVDEAIVPISVHNEPEATALTSPLDKIDAQNRTEATTLSCSLDKIDAQNSTEVTIISSPLNDIDAALVIDENPEIPTDENEPPVKSSDQMNESKVITKSPIANPDKSNEELMEPRRDDSVICISDDESSYEPPNVSIEDNDILRDINSDNDSLVLKHVLTKMFKVGGLEPPTIMKGSGTEVWTLKSLKKHLRAYKIPVEIQYNNVLKVVYKYSPTTPPIRERDTWSKCKTVDLKPRHKTKKMVARIACSKTPSQNANQFVLNSHIAMPPLTSNKNKKIASTSEQENPRSRLFKSLAASANAAAFPSVLGTTQNLTAVQNNYTQFFLVPSSVQNRVVTSVHNGVVTSVQAETVTTVASGKKNFNFQNTIAPAVPPAMKLPQTQNVMVQPSPVPKTTSETFLVNTMVNSRYLLATSPAHSFDPAMVLMNRGQLTANTAPVVQTVLSMPTIESVMSKGKIVPPELAKVTEHNHSNAPSTSRSNPGSCSDSSKLPHTNTYSTPSIWVKNLKDLMM